MKKTVKLKPHLPWKNWAMDVSREEEPYCFCPIEKNGDLVLGMNFIGDMCPGNLVAIFHESGQAAVEKWEQENPDWYKKYKKKPTYDDGRGRKR
jgi:hypothetical protein